jgi:hypothetical protein
MGVASDKQVQAIVDQLRRSRTLELDAPSRRR